MFDFSKTNPRSFTCADGTDALRVDTIAMGGLVVPGTIPARAKRLAGTNGTQTKPLGGDQVL